MFPARGAPKKATKELQANLVLFATMVRGVIFSTIFAPLPQTLRSCVHMWLDRLSLTSVFAWCVPQVATIRMVPYLMHFYQKAASA